MEKFWDHHNMRNELTDKCIKTGPECLIDKVTDCVVGLAEE